MKFSASNISRIYHISQIISLIILVLPSDFKMAVYTPNYLGYFWLLLYPFILGCFVYLSIIDFKKGNKKSLLRRLFIFIGYIALTVGLWYLLSYLYH